MRNAMMSALPWLLLSAFSVFGCDRGGGAGDVGPVPDADGFDGGPEEAGPADAGPPFIYGMHTQSWDMDVERTLRESAQIGATHSVMTFGWEAIEPEPNRFEWSFFDQVIGWGERYGIKIIPQLQYYRDPPEIPFDPADYARYAAAVVERYCDSPGFSRIVQVWNEPNLPHFWRGTPEEYAVALDAAYHAVKEVCPDTVVVGFNVAPSPNLPDWLGRALVSSPGFDWFGWHSYGPPPFQKDPGNPGAGEAAVVLLRAFLDERGFADKPLFDTERGFSIDFGFDTIGALVPQTYIALLSVAREAGVKGFTWYTYHMNGFDDGDFGVVGVGRNWSIRPAYCTYRTMTSILQRFSYDRQIDGAVDSTSLQAHLFRNNNSGVLLTLFAPILMGPGCTYRVCEPVRMRVGVGPASPVTLTDWVGRVQPLTPDETGSVEFGVTSRISYLEIPLPEGSDFSPHLEVVAPCEERGVPIPLEREIVALVSSARSHATTDPGNAAERCFGVIMWHSRLTCCLGADTVNAVVDPAVVREFLARCWMRDDTVYAALDQAFADMEGIPGQETCPISELIPAQEQNELLGKVPPTGRERVCEDY